MNPFNPYGFIDHMTDSNRSVGEYYQQPNGNIYYTTSNQIPMTSMLSAYGHPNMPEMTYSMPRNPQDQIQYFPMPIYIAPFAPAMYQSPPINYDQISNHSKSSKRKSEYDAYYNDDEDDEDDAVESDIRSSGSKPSSRRSSIRENSKMQREKRKLFIQNLENTAKAISNDISNRKQKIEEEYDTLVIVHQVLRSQAREFLRLLFACEIIDNTQETCKSWSELLESYSLGGFEVITPSLSFAYKPPSSRDIRNDDNILHMTTIEQLTSYLSGLKLAYESIARSGTNTCDALYFNLKVDRKSFLSSRNSVSVQAKVESFNAKLLGGLMDISFKGQSRNSIFDKSLPLTDVTTVFAKFDFSPHGDGDKIKRVNLFFNALDIHKQLSDSFTSSIYRPITLKSHRINGDANALSELGQMITSSSKETSQWRVSAQNAKATTLISDLAGHIIHFNESDVAEKLTNWIPYSVYISQFNRYNPSFTVLSSGLSVSLCPISNIYIQVLPYLDDDVVNPSDRNIRPNRLFWTLKSCRNVNDEYFVAYLLYDLFERIIELYDKDDVIFHDDRQTSKSNIEIGSPEESKDNGTIDHTSDLSIRQFFNRVVSLFDSLSHLLLDSNHDDGHQGINEKEVILDRIVSGDEEVEVNVPQPSAMNTTSRSSLFQSLQQFIDWMNYLENLYCHCVNAPVDSFTVSDTNSFEISSADMGHLMKSIEDGAAAVLATMASETRQIDAMNTNDLTKNENTIEKQEDILNSLPLEGNSKIESDQNDSGTDISHSNARSIEKLPELNVTEKNLIISIYNDVNSFFSQVRCSKLIQRLLRLLNLSDMDEDVKIAESFLSLCWTRHHNPSVQSNLMKAKTFLAQKQYDKAFEATNQIILLDPNFAEGYSKRATVYFGMKKSSECVSDINMALHLDPSFYGAYCGKGLMLMRLGDFSGAIVAFKEAIKINPSLERGSLGKTLAYCQDRLIINRRNLDKKH